MNADQPSQAPASRSAPIGNWESIRNETVKAYRDDALIERVRRRLETTGSGRPRSRAIWQAAAALVLFGIGVGVGRGVPGTVTDVVQPQVARATAETSHPGGPARARGGPLQRQEARTRAPLHRTERKRPLSLAVASNHGVALLPSDAPDAVDLEVIQAVAPSPIGPSPRSNWLKLAETGDYAGALAELERSQVAHVVLATGSVEELMTMAEVARFAGNQERAIQALSQVMDRYGGDPNAPLAAMMLGNLLSRSGDSAGAARAFALNRTLSPGGDFAEDALVREFDLALAAGNGTLASSLFDQYALEFPAGPHVYAMRYELDEFLAQGQKPAPSADSAPTDSPTPAEAARSEAARSEGAAGPGERPEGVEPPLQDKN